MQHLSKISVGLSEDRSKFIAYGGAVSPVKDVVYNTVTKWPGWSRKPSIRTTEGVPVAVYTGPVGPVSALALMHTTLAIDWRENASIAQRWVTLLPEMERTLSSPPSLRQYGNPSRKTLQHQAQAIDAIHLLEGRVLLADDMGLGKSATSLWAASYLQCKSILIICPASVKYNWQNEVKLTLGWDSTVIDGNPKKRATIFAELKADPPKAIIINYDLLTCLSDEQLEWLSEYVQDQALICDESHYLKSRKALRTRYVRDCFAHPVEGAKVRLLLTGTPIRNTIEDLYSQIDIIRPGTWTSYWDFCKRHVVKQPIKVGPRTIEKTVGVKDMAGLNAVVNTMQIRRKKEDVLNLPPKIHTYPELELEGDMLKVYKAMKDLAVLELSELEGTATIFSPQARNAVVAAMRCEQIAQGFCGGVPEPLVERLTKILSKKAKPIQGRPKEIVFPEHPKMVWMLEALKTLLGTEKRVVVFSRFNAPMFWLHEQFNTQDVSSLVLHGGLETKAKHACIEDFQDGNADILFCQVSMAEGFNLHNAQDCIFLGRDWSPAINAQAEGRLHRIGQKGTVNIQIPIVRNTIEKMVHTRLAQKDADAEQALKTLTVEELIEAL